MKNSVGKKYPIVLIKFLDHVQCSGEDPRPAECEAVGFLVKEDKDSYQLLTWHADYVINDSNAELFVIVKHPGIKVRRLK